MASVSEGLINDPGFTQVTEETITKVSAPRKARTKLKFLDFYTFMRHKRRNDEEKIEIFDGNEHERGQAERDLKTFAESEVDSIGNQWTVQQIERIVTADNLCSCKDPIDMVFKVNRKLNELAETWTENTGFLTKLAEQTEDFAVQLIDQVNDNKELVKSDVTENVHSQASMLSGLTDNAIVYSQKKLVAHPLLFKRFKMRWLLGLPEFFKRHRILLLPLIVIETFLTPILLPIIAIAWYRDQKKCRLRMLKEKRSDESGIAFSQTERFPGKALDIYYAYLLTPFVLFVKDKLSQVAFILLLCHVCMLSSTVAPSLEEYLIFIFFCGIVFSEYQQYKSSPLKYFKDMWNYIDVLALIIYLFILVMRLVVVIQGGEPSKNRLLEIASYLYGLNTLLLILRFSSIVGLNPTVGPLQLALFRMCVDLFIILIQFIFIIAAFAVAITKCHITGMSNIDKRFRPDLLVDVVGKLMWSLFGLTNQSDMKANSPVATYVERGLFFAFLILSVIMMTNILVALLTKTFDNASNNSEIEWKFARAVLENQYRNLHPIVVPFNLITVPGLYFLLRGRDDARILEQKERLGLYQSYYEEYLFPSIVKRYTMKFGAAFPMSVEEKIDLVVEKLQVLITGEKRLGKQGQTDNESFI
ncbi:short transient receptor potential channel 5-like isoform X2 [Montipora foliosa]|uniref:short transient receptor potential channel 5-like isoform X2 n=1 Tax=Montipora foliosa TaxID=591990 RepID=UPI0035F13EF5